MQSVANQGNLILSELTSQDLNPKDCTLLWQAVVRQVILDVELLISQANQQQAKYGYVSIDKHEQLAEIIIEIADEHFHDCCENAELEVTRVRNHVHSLIDNSNWHQLVFATLIKQDQSGRSVKVA